ncbi:DUF6695 family protein [Polaribacter sp.]|uniref:DUF6695 family protein n=1 Tax=Polaribacter sp. TaxID=1920175 RepID=UPI003F6D95C6
MQNSDGIIVLLSYPDTVVRPAYWEKSSAIWPKIGIGTKHAVQAGHAALLLIKKSASEINYFDFGRYITSYGNGRVRSKETDPELVVPLKAKFKNNELLNLEEILLWIETHPEKTHGDGRLVAGINEEIDYQIAHQYIEKCISKKEIPYGAFIKNGSNCARFVTDTLIASTTNHKIKKRLQSSNLFTPSPIGNVIKATTNDSLYSVENQKLKQYKNRSILKEYKASFFNKFDVEPNLIGTEKPDLEKFNLKNATWLGGIGSGAWFKIETQINTNKITVARYNANGFKDFEGNFTTTSSQFNLKEPFSFIYPTNCKEVFLKQKNNHILFKII